MGGTKTARSQQRGRGEQRDFSLGEIGKGLVGGWTSWAARHTSLPASSRSGAKGASACGARRAQRLRANDAPGPPGALSPAMDSESDTVSRAVCKGQGLCARVASSGYKVSPRAPGRHHALHQHKRIFASWLRTSGLTSARDGPQLLLPRW